MSKNISKYIAAFDYVDRTLILLHATCGGISFIFFMSIVGLFGFYEYCWSIENNKEEKEKKHNKIVMLAKTKLNSIEILMSQALIDLDISHEEFKAIIDEKQRYE